MNRAEALKILGLEQAATEDEIKKKFRKLAFEKHPDRNKSPGAEEEYKQLSVAFEYLKNPPPEPSYREQQQQQQQQQRQNVDSFFRQIRPIFKPQPISVSISMTFKEAVLGCKKKISFNRTGPCPECGGLGHEACVSCSGFGFTETISQRGNITFSQRVMCHLCQGLGHGSTVCEKCTGDQTRQEDIDIDVRIPGGVHNGQIIRLRGGGNVIVQQNMLAQGDVLLTTVVDSDQDMRIKGRDVISTIELSLSDALQGIKKKVRTVKGDLTIMIRKGSKHKDQIKLSSYGVEGRGNHIFTIEVSYPKNTDKLVEFLENNKE